MCIRLRFEFRWYSWEPSLQSLAFTMYGDLGADQFQNLRPYAQSQARRAGGQGRLPTGREEALRELSERMPTDDRVHHGRAKLGR